MSPNQVPSRRLRRQSLVIVGLAVGGLAWATACTRPTAEGKPGFRVDPEASAISLGSASNGTVGFETQQVRRGPVLQGPRITGRVITHEKLTSPAFSPLEGRVQEILVRLGDEVKKGARMVRIKTKDLAPLAHDLRAAQLSIRTKQAIVERLRALVERGAAAQKDLIVAEAELQEARLSAQSSSARLRSLEITRDADDAFWLLAGRDGTVVSLDVVVGSPVQPGMTSSIVTVADLRKVLILGDVPQGEVGGIAENAPVQVYLPGRNTALREARVERVSDVVDPERQTVTVRILCPNQDHPLRPNAFVELMVLPLGNPESLQVPTRAIVTDGVRSVVFVQEADGTLRKRPVEVGRRTRDWAEINGGVELGERVVVDGALLLQNALQTRD